MAVYLEHQEPSQKKLREWMDFFHHNGFLVVRNVLSPERCQQLRQDLEHDIQQYALSTGRKINFFHRMFERSQANLELFDLEPMVTFAEELIGEANGRGWSNNIGIPNSNEVHVIHNNSFIIPPYSDGLADNIWHQDDSPHFLSLDGKPANNIRLNVLTFTINYYLTDVLTVENGPTQIIPGSHLFGKFCPGDIHGYESQVYSCLAPMGSAVCFNNQVWHRGSPNNSDRPRYITQITYAKRLVGHKYYPFINYQMPEHCYQNANPRLKRLLGFLSHGAYG